MSKLIVTEFVTLDGVMEAPGGEPTHSHTGWVFDLMSPEHEQYKLDEVLEAESHLLGRVTYESFARRLARKSRRLRGRGAHLRAGLKPNGL